MKILIFILILLSVSACNIRRDLQPLNLDPPENKISAADLDFKTVNEAVFALSCVSCHSPKAHAGGVVLDNYENVFKNLPQIKMEVAGGMMPPGKPLNQLQTKMLNDWIDAGAKENAKDPIPQRPVPPVVVTPSVPTAPSNPPVEEIRFSVVMEKVIRTNCLGCHSEATGNSGDVNLESYAALFGRRDKVMELVNEQQMPPKSGTPLTAEQKRLLVAWFTQGAKP